MQLGVRYCAYACLAWILNSQSLADDVVPPNVILIFC